MNAGPTIGLQAWGLRRMISCYNGVCRRPHIPREKALRRIMRSQGIDVPLELPPRNPGERRFEPLEDEVDEIYGDDDADYMEENGESECEFEDDPPLAAEASHLSKLVLNCT